MNVTSRRHARTRGDRQLNATDLWAIANDPMMRFADVASGAVLVEHLMTDPQNPNLLQLFGQIVELQRARAVTSGDPFWPNYPPRGSLPRLEPGCIPIAAMTSGGGVLSIPFDSLTRNLLIVGPTGAGKTSFLRAILAAALEAQR